MAAGEVVVVESAVRGESGGVRVRRDLGQSIVSVTWFCGDQRKFLSTAIKEIVQQIETVKDHPDVWVQTKDYNGSRFAVRLDDGELHAETSPRDTTRHVPWAPLKKLLLKAASD